jgi:hypothetical protein
MRPKFVLTLILFAALVLAAAFYFKQSNSQSPALNVAKTTASPPPTAISIPPAAPDSSNLPMIPRPLPTAAPATTIISSMTPEEKQSYIETEVARLQDLSTQDDSASLSSIMNDLTNSEKEVRLAAIEATKQFGSKDAIPVLQADVTSAADTDEKIALLEAADFLSLPSLTDASVQTPPTPDQLQAIQEQRQKAAARKQYLMQKHGQDQNVVPPPGQDSQPPQ